MGVSPSGVKGTGTFLGPQGAEKRAGFEPANGYRESHLPPLFREIMP
ncbi:MAG: hypothetical protein NUV77_17255 [Thermoguttaceae bacterium]|jgi:hypothetical protein|nr:hypothetical protein [Thermoguttaceae bacterium]